MDEPAAAELAAPPAQGTIAGAPDPEPAEGDRSRSPRTSWAWWSALLALAAGIVFAAIGGLAVDLPALAFGVNLTAGHTPGGVAIADTFVQDLCFVGASVYCAHLGGRVVRGWQLGLRRPGVGWRRAALMVVALFLLFLIFSAIWSTLFNPGKDKVLEQLGSSEGSSLLVLSAVLTCVVAPMCEEFLFRGYIFTALRNRTGTLPAALATGLLFGGVHAGSAPTLDLIPLAALGFGLCLLYRYSGSLYPCMLAHAINNAVAFSSLEGFGLAGALALLVGSLACIGLLLRASQALGFSGSGILLGRAPA